MRSTNILAIPLSCAWFKTMLISDVFRTTIKSQTEWDWSTHHPWVFIYHHVLYLGVVYMSVCINVCTICIHWCTQPKLWAVLLKLLLFVGATMPNRESGGSLALAACKGSCAFFYACSSRTLIALRPPVLSRGSLPQLSEFPVHFFNLDCYCWSMMIIVTV